MPYSERFQRSNVAVHSERWRRTAALFFVWAVAGCGSDARMVFSDTTPAPSPVGRAAGGASGAPNSVSSSSAAGGSAGALAQLGATDGGMFGELGGDANFGYAGGAGATPSGVGGAGAGGAGIGVGAGAGATIACTGIPIAPDPFGYVSALSNPLGINGSWFVYSDCQDQAGKPCASVAAPVGPTFPNTAGKMCTSGTTSTASGAWGAGIALELNDTMGQQPYDTVAHGISGFCFVLSGPAIPATLRAAFTTKCNHAASYFEAVKAPLAGSQALIFADTAQGDWVTQKNDDCGQPFSRELTKVMLLQFQIPSQPSAAVSWDFCIEGLTALSN